MVKKKIFHFLLSEIPTTWGKKTTSNHLIFSYGDGCFSLHSSVNLTVQWGLQNLSMNKVDVCSHQMGKEGKIHGTDPFFRLAIQPFYRRSSVTKPSHFRMGVGKVFLLVEGAEPGRSTRCRCPEKQRLPALFV